MEQEPNRDPWEEDENDDQWMEKMVHAAKIGRSEEHTSELQSR